MLSKSRYEGREMVPAAEAHRFFGAFDTFTQAFVSGEVYPTITAAIAAARRLNAAYERATA